MSTQGEFREENFNTAMSVLKDAGDAAKGDQRGRKGGMKRESVLYVQFCVVCVTLQTQGSLFRHLSITLCSHLLQQVTHVFL